MPQILTESVGVVIFDSDFRILLQKRDLKNEIYFSGFFGLFGGLCNDGEKPFDAAVREVDEEISLILKPKYLMDVAFVCEELGFSYRKRTYYIAKISNNQKQKIVLKEGESYAFYDFNNLPSIETIVPFDLSCLLFFMHKFKLKNKLVPCKLFFNNADASYERTAL